MNKLFTIFIVLAVSRCTVAWTSGGWYPADGTFWVLNCYFEGFATDLVVNVTKASFGTKIFNGMGYDPSKDCSKDAYNFVANRCNNRPSCPLEISSNTFGGDPCPNNNATKDFLFEFQCVRNSSFKNEGQALGKQRLAFAPSGQSAILSCADSIGFISTMDAFYGSVSCWSNFANVVNNCSNKKICSVQAAPNSLGTVPCVDPYENPKVLTIAYTCLPPCFVKTSEISTVSGGFNCASNTGYSNVGQALGQPRFAQTVQDESATTLSCSDTTGNISIQEANYGLNTCWTSVLNQLKTTCNNKKICSGVTADNSVLGVDPCYGQRKVLTVVYTCL